MSFAPGQEKNIRLYFRISVILKGLGSLSEVVAGLLAFLISPALVSTLIIRLAQGELTEDPHDFIAAHLVSLAQQFSFQSGTFIAVYLLSRGLIKLGLIIALLKNKLWAYPSSLGVLGLFVLYQLYQIAGTFSLPLIALTLFDCIVMWFIWREYQVLRARQS